MLSPPLGPLDMWREKKTIEELEELALAVARTWPDGKDITEVPVFIAGDDWYIDRIVRRGFKPQRIEEIELEFELERTLKALYQLAK